MVSFSLYVPGAIRICVGVVLVFDRLSRAACTVVKLAPLGPTVTMGWPVTLLQSGAAPELPPVLDPPLRPAVGLEPPALAPPVAERPPTPAPADEPATPTVPALLPKLPATPTVPALPPKPPATPTVPALASGLPTPASFEQAVASSTPENARETTRAKLVAETKCARMSG